MHGDRQEHAQTARLRQAERPGNREHRCQPRRGDVSAHRGLERRMRRGAPEAIDPGILPEVGTVDRLDADRTAIGRLQGAGPVGVQDRQQGLGLWPEVPDEGFRVGVMHDLHQGPEFAAFLADLVRPVAQALVRALVERVLGAEATAEGAVEVEYAVAVAHAFLDHQCDQVVFPVRGSRGHRVVRTRVQVGQGPAVGRGMGVPCGCVPSAGSLDRATEALSRYCLSSKPSS